MCAGLPGANELTMHLLAAVGEYERKLVSERTKAALAAAKARGVKLGHPNVHLRNKKTAVEAPAFAEDLRPKFEHLTGKELSRQAMVEELNRPRIPVARGDKWNATQVQRVAARIGL